MYKLDNDNKKYTEPEKINVYMDVYLYKFSFLHNLSNEFV